MLTSAEVHRDIVAYRLKLEAMSRRFEAGERSTIATEAQTLGDELICLMDEAPLSTRKLIDYLIDRYEALRANCMS